MKKTEIENEYKVKSIEQFSSLFVFMTEGIQYLLSLSPKNAGPDCKILSQVWCYLCICPPRTCSEDPCYGAERGSLSPSSRRSWTRPPLCRRPDSQTVTTNLSACHDSQTVTASLYLGVQSVSEDDKRVEGSIAGQPYLFERSVFHEGLLQVCLPALLVQI